MSTLQVIFITVLNMSLTASYVAVGVILIRLLLKKAPKIFSYALWLAVLIRLVCPFSFTSAFSFFNLMETSAKQNSGVITNVPYNIGLMQNPSINLGINSINKVVNNSLPPVVPTASVNPMQIVMSILSVLWVIGFALLVLHGIISYLKVVRNVKTATLLSGKIFETDRITTPFVCGFIRPKIYIPTGIAQNDLSYILAHEMIHIRRHDYLIKPFSYLVLLLHWFNPLMWLCFFMMNKDMEMSCDESVLKSFGDEIKANYSRSLLNLATDKSYLISGGSLAFGESNAKARIKNVLGYKKPALWVIATGLVAIAALVVVFTANPKNQEVPNMTVHSGYVTRTLLANKTPYVGDNSKVVALIDAMPLPAGIVRDKIELQTSATPYAITINYIGSNAGQETRTSDVFYRNSLLLFSLIENVEVINCQIHAGSGKDNNSSYTLTYTRAMADNLLGGDVRHYASSSESLTTLIDHLNNMTLLADASSQAAINNQIETYLATIMSSPQTSSNPQEYINAHRDEYNAILGLDAQALPHLFSQFEKGGQTGLKGALMEKLCRSILGPWDITYANNPQDWYEHYKKYTQRLTMLNSLEFVQQQNPKGSLILSLGSN
jgi:bla regulator protein blaR1